MIAATNRRQAYAACMFVLWVAKAHAASAQVLDLPLRPADAPGGAELAEALRALDFQAREERIGTEFARGNIPSWLRTLVPVEMARLLGGREHRVKFWVTPDYVAVGSDDDHFFTPLSPQSAQRIADIVGASLPTPPMVDAVWRTAQVRLAPSPIPPSAEMTTVPVFGEHNRMVRAQRIRESAPAGALVAGHKKDVVLTSQLDVQRGKVAIYGWHREDGSPIQNLYTGHTDRWVDYSHGIRLVARMILVDGVPRDMTHVLRDPALAGLLSDDGPMVEPRYPLSVVDTARVPSHPRERDPRARRSSDT